MKRKNIILTVIIALALGLANVNPTQAQVFIMEEDDHTAPRAGTSNFNNIPNVPWEHDSTLDYTPVGSGLWVLGCLGGAYLLGKRRRKEE